MFNIRFTCSIVHLYDNENKDDSELPEFSADDNMISRTENERLEAWKFFRLRNLEERPVPQTPYPTARIEPERHKHDVYTKSGKRISFPLPGWMEDFQSKNRPRSSGTNNLRYARCVWWLLIKIKVTNKFRSNL